MPDLSEFLTTREAARMLGFSARSIPYMIKRKTLEGVRMGRTWLVAEKSVREYLSKTRRLRRNDPRRHRIP